MSIRADWQSELAFVDDLMRTISRQTDPQEMVRLYGEGIDKIFPTREFMALSRRGLDSPYYRITRSTRFTEEINPWRQRDKLPVLQGGVLGELVYANEPRIIEDLKIEPSDPGYPYLSGLRTVVTLPQYDDGQSLNVAVMLWKEKSEFDVTRYPNMLWQANLFGRATYNMVLRQELAAAYHAIDREFMAVGEIQRSLLPQKLPEIPGLDLAASYETSRRAGGDYYDLFKLADGAWGIFIADVSGHGTPAAVMMAITHAIAHNGRTHPSDPAAMLTYLNSRLAERYTSLSGSFITAFYAVYQPQSRMLTFANAGHPPPRWRSSDQISALEGEIGMPLGILANEAYATSTCELKHGDGLLLYTDGITEAFDPDQEMFDLPRLDAAIAGSACDADCMIRGVLGAVAGFTRGHPADDDRTLLALRVHSE